MSPVSKLLILCAVIPFVTPQCNIQNAERSFSRVIFEFSSDLLRRLAEDNEGHFVSSTLSPWTLLTAVSFGAAEDTLTQIQQVLQHHAVPCFNYKYLKIAKNVANPDPGATLERSSALFIDNALGLKLPFQAKLRTTGVCEIIPISFEDFSNAAYQINDYVKRSTHDVIEEMVAPSDLEGVYLMMIDALFFKGSWKKPFAIENTEKTQFFDSDGNVLGDVNLMFVSGQFNITPVEPIQATVLELPYGESGRFSMLVFLPDEGVSLLNMIVNLKKITLVSIFSEFKRRGPQTVLVQLPRFKISSELSQMKELLIDMGLRDMFDKRLARFPYLTNYELYVSSFIQKAEIEVTEKGTVAAAVTELGMSFRSSILALEFVANKPFMFMVVDRESNLPVFSGAYSKPSPY